MFQNNLLDRRSQNQLFLSRPASSQMTIESSSVHLRQMTHSLDAEAALQRHPCPYLVIDAFAPETMLWRRRAPTFCKARLQKSTSIVLFASSLFSLVICLQRMSSRERTGLGLPS